MATIAEIKCDEVQSIKDFHKKLGEWNDYHGGGKGDRNKVSCKQTGKDYDELMNKYNKYYKPNKYSEKDIAQAMCQCCKEKLLTRKLDTFAKLLLSEEDKEWDAFYACMKEKGYEKYDPYTKLFDFKK